MTNSQTASTEHAANYSYRIAVTVIVCLTSLVWGVFIWPTQYRYEKVTLKPNERQEIELIYRINRFTGYMEKILPHTPSGQD